MFQMIVWDVGCGEAVNVIDCHPDVIYSMSFNRDGSLIATTCKDKKLRVIEPRRGIVLSVSHNLCEFYNIDTLLRHPVPEANIYQCNITMVGLILLAGLAEYCR